MSEKLCHRSSPVCDSVVAQQVEVTEGLHLKSGYTSQPEKVRSRRKISILVAIVQRIQNEKDVYKT